MNIIASIDVGSRSFSMCVAKVSEGEFQMLEEHYALVQLKSFVNAHGQLDPKGMDKACVQLASWIHRARSKGATYLLAGGTQVLRMANNAHECVARALSLGLDDFRILSGEEEAYLSFLGAVQGFEGELLGVLDWGSASLECTVGSTAPLDLRETFSIPMQNLEVQSLAPTLCPRIWIVQGGTVLALAQWIFKVQELSELHGKALTARALRNFLNHSWELYRPERWSELYRAAELLELWMKRLDLDQWILSIHGLRHGMILDCCNYQRHYHCL